MFGKPNKKGVVESSSESEEEVKPVKKGAKGKAAPQKKKVESSSSSDEEVVPVQRNHAEV